ncbi:MAG: hypothetical protein UT54_C0019G0012 [Candidatus Daviesbacteria bacterium GW2011_GWB1_39_5]|uniref:Uncharacterized protein n=1 Tax=Candidatus Daviesbacteria bacterium GW2011_GWC2_40_12 TaxID=1618431 RepID=A0A0G0T5I8_9BACT|nr:MAG: hypothetical protein UT04_C0003G0007 [Candidatus Daviesbacteria bacterium GW2011_GWF2_38_7]KKR16818.1 MAG: hypothetical protein UT45_C0004G0149 [Candidatus Daviesbacteria bacterium GW2011_GWA2_39_33]KKR24469.1 MAG: hypothetical protein UT54_C0019G0012 [Candidatus Daviesbacteria bacterium GW2011_GWB1_39_5]KKR42400.1 MAG: hypothetical protein UT77_C0002G0053 [Candidatus Daviesbacteria bacterium GW2011_GWC2_40_12]
MNDRQFFDYFAKYQGRLRLLPVQNLKASIYL